MQSAEERRSFTEFFKSKIKSKFYKNFNEEKSGGINSFEDIVNTIELATLDGSAPERKEEEAQESTPLAGGQDPKKVSDDQRALAYSRLRAIFLQYAAWVAALGEDQRPQITFPKDYLDQLKKAIDDTEENLNAKGTGVKITWHHEHYRNAKRFAFTGAFLLMVGEVYAALSGLNGIEFFKNNLGWLYVTTAVVGISAIICNMTLLFDELSGFYHKVTTGKFLQELKESPFSTGVSALLGLGAGFSYAAIAFHGFQVDDCFGLVLGEHSSGVPLGVVFSAVSFVGFSVLFINNLMSLTEDLKKFMTAYKKPEASNKGKVAFILVISGFFAAITTAAMFFVFKNAISSLFEYGSTPLAAVGALVYLLFGMKKVLNLCKGQLASDPSSQGGQQKSGCSRKLFSFNALGNSLAYAALASMPLILVDSDAVSVKSLSFLSHDVLVGVGIVVALGASLLSFAPHKVAAEGFWDNHTDPSPLSMR